VRDLNPLSQNGTVEPLQIGTACAALGPFRGFTALRGPPPLLAELARPLLIEESEGRERLLTDPQEDPMANKNRKNELSIFIDVPFGLDLWTLFTLDLD